MSKQITWIKKENKNENYIATKEVDFTTFVAGFDISKEYYSEVISNITDGIKPGITKWIKISINDILYNCQIVCSNQNNLGIRLRKDEELMKLLKDKLSLSYNYINNKKAEVGKGKIDLPDDYKEYIDIYKGDEKDLFVFELISKSTQKDVVNDNLKNNSLEADEDIEEEILNKSFTIVTKDSINESRKDKDEITIKEVKGRKIDFNKLNNVKKTIGLLGEIIVLNMEKENLVKNGREDLCKKVQHISLDKGDGYGYDILSFDLNGGKKYIEVKTTTSDEIDNYYITPNEISISNKDEFKDSYYIYRLYNLNVKEYRADLKIYKGSINEKDYELVPEIYRVKVK